MRVRALHTHTRGSCEGEGVSHAHTGCTWGWGRYTHAHGALVRVRPSVTRTRGAHKGEGVTRTRIGHAWVWCRCGRTERVSGGWLRSMSGCVGLADVDSRMNTGCRHGAYALWDRTWVAMWQHWVLSIVFGWKLWVVLVGDRWGGSSDSRRHVVQQKSWLWKVPHGIAVQSLARFFRQPGIIRSSSIDQRTYVSFSLDYSLWSQQVVVSMFAARQLIINCCGMNYVIDFQESIDRKWSIQQRSLSVKSPPPLRNRSRFLLC